MTTAAGVSAMVTAFDRVEQAIETIRRIMACEPRPAQVLVHVDDNRVSMADRLRAAHPGVEVLISTARVGPGGGRNRMMAAASGDLVASFDDDSYPIDTDFFERARQIFERFTGASVVTGRVIHAHESMAAAEPTAAWIADFSGGACVYRRAHYLDAGGYVPLPMAYGMEEVDLALRLHARGRRILRTEWLRVHHDTDLARHADADVTAASLANIALLAYLRYPVALWGIGALQLANRLQWLLRNGRQRGIVSGVLSAMPLMLAHRSRREPLDGAAIRSYLSLRRHPVPAAWSAA